MTQESTPIVKKKKVFSTSFPLAGNFGSSYLGKAQRPQRAALPIPISVCVCIVLPIPISVCV